MTVSVILAHPTPGSFNHAIAAAARDALRANGHEVISHDLCAEGFPPLLPAGEISEDAPLPHIVQEHCNEIQAADGIIVVHPNWWGQPPAILKGWIDRVLRPGVAYRFEEGDQGEGVPVGLLRAGSAIVFNTSDTRAEREQSVFGDPLELIWKKCIFELCGVSEFYREMFAVVVTSSKAERMRWLERVRTTVSRVFHRTAG